MEKIKLLSLVVPTYKQQGTIADNINSLKKTLDALNVPFEIIVVVDGKIDKTYEEVSKIKSRYIRVLGYKENRGKGHAVQYGMLRAKGDIIGFIDAGMDIDPTGISMLLNHMIWYDADIIVGSKLHPVSKVNYPLYRKVLSWGYRTYTRLLFGLMVKDTQVGIKFYKREVVEKVFPKLLVKQFAFDIETLAVAHALGYTRIFEAPIKLNFNNVSSITSRKYRKVVWNMFWDTAAVFYRIKIKKYYQNLS
jgi:glycosyltransferase involved in cell wall biosynthesis